MHHPRSEKRYQGGNLLWREEEKVVLQAQGSNENFEGERCELDAEVGFIIGGGKAS